ncbi:MULTISPECIES: lipase family alpha/beta hydrolase [Vibrio]|jgi:uncharacterized alpha/beta hydrolase family protein|uniref:lipase family alpha/beta hydrolase n=1 Tax=Vibrio TaxID=662 RepID=UPI000C9DA8BC|nr:cobinamide adenolsyltransferase [Vibrio diazotrophicus]MCZ4371750.1 triacylglycerol lipase [Vibrio diazotrophicus]PNH94021.1 cobinamide adenolsyltransferase [Vibrio diazotrophicus]PNH98595.1 cobinamide adenolsyltransferase [Vibrio diazotrophicus]
MKVIILHGLYMHGIAMLPLSQRLEKLGYDTEVVSYNSVAIDERKVFPAIDKALDHKQVNVLVGHSLGGVVIKRYLASRKPDVDTISHVVALGSPINGASIVGKIQQMGLGVLLGNSAKFGLQKHEDKWEFPQKLGSLAGTVPLGVRSILMGKDTHSDGTVTVDETKIAGMTAHHLMRNTHTSMIYSSKVAEQIDHFIRHDTFARKKARIKAE